MSQQPATFVFMLRRNIALEGDLALAERELAAFLGCPAEPVADLAAETTAHQATKPSVVAEERRRPAGPTGERPIAEFGSLGSYCRTAGIQGYRAGGPLALLVDLVRSVSFHARIQAVTDDTPAAREWLARAERECGPVWAWEAVGGRLTIQAIPHNLLFELSGVVVRRAKSAQEVRELLAGLLDALVGRPADKRCQELATEALAAHQTTSHLFHDLHYYKAKFFPRMVRSVLNTCARRLGPGPHRVLDPFAGSGTTLLEASLLGLPSAGFDLDPLSVLIARSKLQGLRAGASEVERVAGTAIERLDHALRLGLGGGSQQEGRPYPGPGGREVAGARIGTAGGDSQGDIGFPAWLTKNRRFTPDIAAQLSSEIQVVRAVLDGCDPEWLGFLRVLISDAISRRIRMRLLGTGVGRFSLTYSAATLPQIVRKSLARTPRIAAAAEWLRDTLGLRLADAASYEGDARRLPAAGVRPGGVAGVASGDVAGGVASGAVGKYDIVLTSPPYLPASSGRETYSKARVLSFLALGMLERDGIDALVDDAIGSMDASPGPEALSLAEQDLVNWLRSDELRAIKAEPTARYFRDMRETFRQMRQVLAPGAVAVVVSGRQSTFYQFSTRAPLYVAESARLLADGAREAGFEVEELLDVQLAKSNMNARPRALDDYYETLIVLR